MVGVWRRKFNRALRPATCALEASGFRPHIGRVPRRRPGEFAQAVQSRLGCAPLGFARSSTPRPVTRYASKMVTPKSQLFPRRFFA